VQKDITCSVSRFCP